MVEKYQLAYQDYKSGMKQKDIAAKYNVSINTVKSWQQRKWRGMDNANEKVCTPNEKSMHTKKGAPRGNKNAVGNTGGAPLKNQNAKGNRGGSAPQGNKNAVTTGEYESLMWDYLDDDERELYGTIETDPLFQIDRNVRELTIRQRRMMKRIKTIEEGLTEKQRRVLQQLRKVKEAATGADSQTVTITKERMVTVEVEEMIFRKIDDILNLEEALTRVTNQLVRAIKQKHEIEKSNSEQQVKLKHMKLNVKKLKAEIEKIQSRDTTTQESEIAKMLRKIAGDE